ncbi:hypothetical protein MD484_g8661, partial [Candolleomyces efflorescens]
MEVDLEEDVNQLSRIQEVNIYKSAWENDDGENTKEEAEGELNIERLLNKDTADMFALCYGGDHERTEDKEDKEAAKPDPTDEDQMKEDDELTKHQKTYMDTWRHRQELAKEKPDMDEERVVTERECNADREGVRKPDVAIEREENNCLLMLFELLKMKEAIKLGAFTGIAASLIGGQTLHSLLAMNPSKKSSVTRKLTENWKGVKYLIIDEVSMIGASFLAKISARLRHANGDNQVEAEKPFGGVNLIFMAKPETQTD